MAATVFFHRHHFTRRPDGSTQFFLFPLLRETRTASWGNWALTSLTNTLWITRSMQMLSSRGKKELGREVSFPSQMCPASRKCTRVVGEGKEPHGPLQCGTANRLPWLHLVIYTNTVSYLLARSWVLIRRCSPSHLVVLWNLEEKCKQFQWAMLSWAALVIFKTRTIIFEILCELNYSFRVSV